MSLVSLMLKKKRKPVHIGLALGGGGARGFAHIAFLKVLDDLGLRPTLISGASMGALMGALYASGLSGREIERTVKELNLVDMITLVDVSWHTPRGLIKGEKITKTISTLIRNKNFEDLDIPLKVVATDFWDRKEVVYDKGNVAQAIRASISIPAVFEPVVINNTLMMDGGLVNSLPYEMLRETCDLTIAINVVGDKLPKADKREKPKFFEALLSAFEIYEAAAIENKLHHAQPDIYIKPEIKNIDLLDFHLIDEIIDGVKKDAQAFKQQLTAYLQLEASEG